MIAAWLNRSTPLSNPTSYNELILSPLYRYSNIQSIGFPVLMMRSIVAFAQVVVALMRASI